MQYMIKISELFIFFRAGSMAGYWYHTQYICIISMQAKCSIIFCKYWKKDISLCSIFSQFLKHCKTAAVSSKASTLMYFGNATFNATTSSRKKNQIAFLNLMLWTTFPNKKVHTVFFEKWKIKCCNLVTLLQIKLILYF